MVQAAAVVPAKARERLDIEWMDDDGGRSIRLMVPLHVNSPGRWMTIVADLFCVMVHFSQGRWGGNDWNYRCWRVIVACVLRMNIQWNSSMPTVPGTYYV